MNPSLRTSGFDVISAPIAGASSAAPVTTERTPAGRPASLRERCDGERRQRRLLGRLEDHRAAGGQGGRGLPGRHRRREVPRRDARGHPDRLLEDEDAPVAARRRDRVAVRALRLLAEPLVERGGVRDLGARLGQRLALFDRRAGARALPRARASGRRAAAARRPGPSPSRDRHSGYARPAAAIARRVSAAPMRGTSATTSPEAGLVTGNVSPESESAHRPSR